MTRDDSRCPAWHDRDDPDDYALLDESPSGGVCLLVVALLALTVLLVAGLWLMAAGR